MIPVDASNVKTTGRVEFNGSLEARQGGVAVTVGDQMGGSETGVSGDSVEKRNPLDIKIVSTQSNVAVVLKDGWRKGNCRKSGDVGSRGPLCGTPFEKGDVFSIDD